MTSKSIFEFTKSTFEKGVGELHLRSWKDFVTYIHEAIISTPDFVWRGQRSENWPLQPSLERVLSNLRVPLGSDEAEALRSNQLNRFKLSARGHIDPRDLEERNILFSEQLPQNDLKSRFSESTPLGPSFAEREENNWWAIGQHYGLNTPLLDWSTSPFVSAFFAFSQPTPKNESQGRAIYGLHKTRVSQKADEIRESWTNSSKPPTVDFIEPLYKNNPRLVSQGGLFTRSPNGQNVREWVEANHPSVDEEVWLLKIVLPDKKRESILKALNRMNINHQSLFPDLYGTTKFVNLKLTIADY